MLLLVRRFLVLAALFFWQGGFTFYASVVVPVAQKKLGHLRQGFITREVTVYLNYAGAAALIVLLGDVFVRRDPARWRRASRWLLWVGMLFTLLWLFQLHGQMDELLVSRGRIVTDPDLFRVRHRIYLWISTVQWVCALLYMLITVAIWRMEDRVMEKKMEM